MSALHFATRLVWTLGKYFSWANNNSVDYERWFWRRRNTKCWGHISKYVHLSFWAFWNGCTSCQHFGWKLPYFTWISCYLTVTLWSKYHSEYHMQEICYHLHRCTQLTPLCRMTEHLTTTPNFKMFHQSLPHWKHDKWLSQLCSVNSSHVCKTSSVASTWLQWDNKVSWQKTEKSIVTLVCMYMSVKCIGKRCYVHCKSSKPVKRIIPNLCINYHIKRWFAQSEVSSSL